MAMAGEVLIVDDDPALADNLAEIVETLAAHTTIARDRRSALALAATADFDVALVDVRLPDGDGIGLLAPLRERSPFVEVVLITGDATLEGAMAAVRGGAFAYVLKPFSPPDLLDTVRRARAQAQL
jgi:DNA-binding NtrC family response regulator